APTRRRRTPTSSRSGMSEVSLTAAFSTVPAGDQEAFKRVIVETVEQLAREDAGFKRAKLVFTESDERCALTAELDGVKREGVPLQIEIDQLEDAQSSAGARAQLKEALRLYFRRVQQPAADADAAGRRPRGRAGRGRQRRARRLGAARSHHRGRARAPGLARPARVHDLRLPRHQDRAREGGGGRAGALGARARD